MESVITRTICPCCGANNISKYFECKDYLVSKETFEIWQCAKCSIRFTQYAPDAAGIGRYYQSESYISHTDTEEGLVNKIYKVARNYTLNWKLKLLDRGTGKQNLSRRLLDIGAGTGAFLNKAKLAGWPITGLEPDERARKICLDKYKIQLDVPERLFELPANEFDVITMWHVLEHVHQLQEYLHQIRQVLKKTGVLFIALPNYTSPDAVYYGANWAAYDVPRHLYHFSPASMRRLVEIHGLMVDSLQPMWLDAFYIAMLSEQYKTGKNNLLPAVINGMRSNWQALKRREECSSLVYVIRHK